MTSHEAALADANLAAYTQACAERDAFRERAQEAELYCAYIIAALVLWSNTENTPQWMDADESLMVLAKALAIGDMIPGAQMLAELEAARAVVAAARAACEKGD